jgi:hypothetical protein
MTEIKNTLQLLEAIESLKIKQKLEEQELKEEFTALFEKIQPINVIRETVNELVESKSLQTDVIDLSLGTATGFAIRKLIVGETKNPIGQILGRMIEQTVSQKIISNRVVIHNIGRNVLNLFASGLKKEKTN